MRTATITLAPLVIGAGVALSAATGHAETGAHPHLDQTCAAAAFAASGPTVTIGARNPQVIEQPLVGLRAQNAYCSSPGFKHPASYGGGPEIDEDD